MPWVREGDCPTERCRGRCCKHIGLWFPKEGHDFAKSLAIRGVNVKEAAGMYLLDFQQKCQYLTGRGLCRLHPAMNPPASLPERPAFCGEWPTEPSQLLNDPYCGFTFKWVEEEIGNGID
jgi:hypothetical protein